MLLLGPTVDYTLGFVFPMIFLEQTDEAVRLVVGCGIDHRSSGLLELGEPEIVFRIHAHRFDLSRGNIDCRSDGLVVRLHVCVAKGC